MIVPALLTSDRREFTDMIKTCAEFTDYVQIDIMDGEFVPSKSIGIVDLEGFKAPLRCEAHLMVLDPVAWIKPFKNIGAERIVYHFESSKNHLEVISKIRESGLGAGIAINPPTSIAEFEFLAEEVDTVLFMSVNPGFYGSAFMPEVLAKIRAFKDKYPQKEAGIDGGIKLDKMIAVKKTGLDYICVGSAILKSNNPGQAYRNFLNLFHE